MLIGHLPTGAVTGRRVAVTGIGAVSCAGRGADHLFEALCEGKEPSSRNVPAFDDSDLGGPKELRRLDPFALFALAAATDAWTQSGLPSHVADGASIIATGIGGLQTLTTQLNVLNEKGPDRVSPFMIPMMMPNAAAAAVSLRFGLTGPCETITTACAAGTHAIGHAARLIAQGRVTVAVAGGAEAVITPVALAGFRNMTALSSTGHSQPFGRHRDGFVMGEGAGVLVLEEWDHAVARGAPILAEISGASSTADSHHITAPRPDGGGAIDAIRRALSDAGVAPTDVSHVNAHGTSTPLNDAAEAAALHAVFGDSVPPVTSNKGYLGHSLAAAGALEAVVTVLSITRGLVPPTAGTTELDDDLALDVVVGTPRAMTSEHVLSNSFGFGGHNGSLVISSPGR